MDKKTLDLICTRLSHFLADSFVLYTKTLNFHWNMVGPQFFMYHKLLEEQYRELAEANDEIAERIRMLGKFAPATLQEYLQLTTLKEPKTRQSEQKMVAELVKDNEQMVKHAQMLINVCDEVKESGSSDLLVSRLRAHDKNAWLLRTHLEKK